jgi:hypothetical protein
MKFKPPVFLALFILAMLGTMAMADQIVLKDGTMYSGKFISGDARIVSFKILNRVEDFKTSDIDKIIFKEPELTQPASARTPNKPVQLPSIPESPAPPRNPVPAVESTEREYEKDSVGNPRSTQMILPVGTPITIRTTSAIDTDRNRVGDVFDAILEQPLVWGNQTIARRGAAAKGRIAYAQESGKFAGKAQLILELTDLVINGKSYMVRTTDYTEAGANRANRTAATVGGTAALGAIIGAIAGGGTGAAVGAASGAAVGTGVQVLTKGQVLRIPAETILEFRLQSPLNLD